jgi:hypothetical protein
MCPQDRVSFLKIYDETRQYIKLIIFLDVMWYSFFFLIDIDG